jgi:hypothetical protein
MLNWWQEWLHHAPQGDHSFIAEKCAAISDVLIMVNYRLELFFVGFFMISCCHLLGP